MNVRVDILFGHVEIVPTCRFDAQNNRMVLGAYSVSYDKHGNERSRTKDEPNLYVYYGESGEKVKSVPSWYRRLWEMLT